MIIKVSLKHIKNGETTSSCPIALAVKEQTGENDVSVDKFDIMVAGATGSDTPRSAARFIKRFDEGKSVKPFNFKLNLKKNAI